MKLRARLGLDAFECRLVPTAFAPTAPAQAGATTAGDGVAAPWTLISGQKLNVADKTALNGTNSLTFTMRVPAPNGGTQPSTVTVVQTITVQAGWKLVDKSATEIDWPLLKTGTQTVTNGVSFETQHTQNIDVSRAFAPGATALNGVIGLTVEKAVVFGRATGTAYANYRELSSTIDPEKETFKGKDVKVAAAAQFLKVTYSYEMVTKDGVDLVAAMNKSFPGADRPEYAQFWLNQRLELGRQAAVYAGLQTGIAEMTAPTSTNVIWTRPAEDDGGNDDGGDGSDGGTGGATGSSGGAGATGGGTGGSSGGSTGGGTTGGGTTGGGGGTTGGGVAGDPGDTGDGSGTTGTTSGGDDEGGGYYVNDGSGVHHVSPDDDGPGAGGTTVGGSVGGDTGGSAGNPTGGGAGSTGGSTGDPTSGGSTGGASGGESGGPGVVAPPPVDVDGDGVYDNDSFDDLSWWAVYLDSLDDQPAEDGPADPTPAPGDDGPATQPPATPAPQPTLTPYPTTQALA